MNGIFIAGVIMFAALVIGLFVAMLLLAADTDRCDPDVIDEWWGNEVTTVELPAYVTGWRIDGRAPKVSGRHAWPTPSYLAWPRLATRRVKRDWALFGRYTAVIDLYTGLHRKGIARGSLGQRHPVSVRMQHSVELCWNARPVEEWRWPSWEYPTTELHFSLLALLDEEGALV